jgi:hypothetical protein
VMDTKPSVPWANTAAQFQIAVEAQVPYEDPLAPSATQLRAPSRTRAASELPEDTMRLDTMPSASEVG